MVEMMRVGHMHEYGRLVMNVSHVGPACGRNDACGVCVCVCVCGRNDACGE